MALTEESITKRLRGINTTQESIQNTSLWILHHKDAYIDKVAKCWMEVYKKGNDTLRTALVFVMNDAVQKAGKKDRNDSVKMAFHPMVVNACAIASPAVKKSIGRCVHVFEERRVFPAHIISEMKEALNAKKRTEEPDDTLGEIDHIALIREIEGYYTNEEITEKARNILARSDFNFKEKMQDKMKDRAGGTKILNEMEDSRNKLNQFLNSVEKHHAKCQKVREMLQAAKSSLNQQLRDVTIVDDAYEKFALGIKSTKKELEQIIKSGNFPGMSPPRDAPSPEPNFDPFGNTLGQGASEDMDMDDDEVPGASISVHLSMPSKAPIPTIPASSALDPRLQRLLGQRQQSMQQNNSQLQSNQTDQHPSSTIDPRQASRQSHPPKLQTNPNFATGSQPGPVVFSPATGMQTMKLDTSHPPPTLFSPSGHPQNQMSPLPPMMFDPNKPPPFGFTPMPDNVPPPHTIPTPPPRSKSPQMPKMGYPYSIPPPGFGGSSGPFTMPLPPGEAHVPPGFPSPSGQMAPFPSHMPPPGMIGTSPPGGHNGQQSSATSIGQKRRYSDSHNRDNGNDGGKLQHHQSADSESSRRSFHGHKESNHHALGLNQHRSTHPRGYLFE
ncbi:RNA polymerase II-binding domain-containing protein [Ditylenchus destructor]|nr:RNA polymerase II-binding domain-containing protein [Ditylenchus destructor]